MLQPLLTRDPFALLGVWEKSKSGQHPQLYVVLVPGGCVSEIARMAISEGQLNIWVPRAPQECFITFFAFYQGTEWTPAQPVMLDLEADIEWVVGYWQTLPDTRLQQEAQRLLMHPNFSDMSKHEVIDYMRVHYPKYPYRRD